MSVGKKQVEEILGISFRARPKEMQKGSDLNKSLIIHRQIHGEEIYVPLNKDQWGY